LAANCLPVLFSTALCTTPNAPLNKKFKQLLDQVKRRLQIKKCDKPSEFFVNVIIIINTAKFEFGWIRCALAPWVMHFNIHKINKKKVMLTRRINESYRICHNQMEPFRQFLFFSCQYCPQSIVCLCFLTLELN
jgi:hypothetical protein